MAPKVPADPMLLDGDPLPNELERKLLSGFFMKGRCGISLLQRVMIEHTKLEVSVEELEAALAPLKTRGLIIEVPNPPRPPPRKDFPLIPDFRTPGDPEDGERCYGLTADGRKALALLGQLHHPLRGPWILGSAGLVEQIVLAAGSNPVGETAVHIDEKCCLSPTADVTSMLETVQKDGLLEKRRELYILTPKGQAARARAQEKWQEKSLEHVMTPQAIPNGWTLALDFVADAAVKAVLEQNVRELAYAQIAALPTTALVLAGAIAEGVLYDALVQRRARAMAATAAPKLPARQGGHVRDIETDKWSLSNLIDVALEIGLLRRAAGKTTHDVLRHFRNLIHPKVQVETGIEPTMFEVSASIVWLESLAADVRKASNP